MIDAVTYGQAILLNEVGPNDEMESDGLNRCENYMYVHCQNNQLLRVKYVQRNNHIHTTIYLAISEVVLAEKLLFKTASIRS